MLLESMLLGVQLLYRPRLELRLCVLPLTSLTGNYVIPNANPEWREACIRPGMEDLGRNFDRRVFFGTANGRCGAGRPRHER